MSDDCIGCNPEHQSGYMCPSCKESLEVGNLVRKMPVFHRLCKADPKRDGAEWLVFTGEACGPTFDGTTAIDVLRKSVI
jgi:hypothetical protein